MYETTNKHKRSEFNVLVGLRVMKNHPYSKDELIMTALIGNNVHIQCDCLMMLDIKGYVNNAILSNGEIMIYITDSTTNKTINIGMNHPGLKISII